MSDARRSEWPWMRSPRVFGSECGSLSTAIVPRLPSG